MTEKNIKAKTFLKDFDFSQEGAELSYCINALGGSATQKGDKTAYLYKAGDVPFSKEDLKIIEDVKKAETLINVDIENLEEILEESLRTKIRNTLPGFISYVSVWVEKFSSSEVIYTVDYDRCYKASYTVNNGVVTISDNVVAIERKLIYLETGNIVKSNLRKENFASSENEDPLSWKFRFDTVEHLKSSISYLEKSGDLLTEGDKLKISNSLLKRFKEICSDEETPQVLKSSEINTSGAASDGNTNESMPSGINDNINKKGNMSEKDSKVLDNETLELKKSVEDLTKLVKAANERAEKAEKAAADIAKAAEAEQLAKAKNDLTEVVKGWKAVESVNEVVEALFKSEGREVLIKAMDQLNEKVEEVKKKFGESEEGLDGHIEVSKDVNKSAAEAVSKALAKLTANKKNK